jgi:Type IV secretory system Conjugative DNA transfer
MNDSRKLFLTLTSITGLILMMEYLTTVSNTVVRYLPSLDVLNNKKFAYFFIEEGILFRAFFLFLFFVFAYGEVIKMSANNKKIKKLTYKLLFGSSTLLFGLAFVFIRDVEFLRNNMKILYPVFLFSCMFCIYYFVQAITMVSKKATEHKKLGAEKELVDDEDTLVIQGWNGNINIRNPYRGILVNGNAGSGKSASIAEQIIYQLVDKEYAGFIYDFKDFDLTNVVYSAYAEFKRNKVQLKIINFNEPSRSHRINPIHPRYIEDSIYLQEYITAIVQNLKKQWIKNMDFFADAGVAMLKGLTWFLKNREPEMCTIPHLFTLINEFSVEEIVEMVKQDKEASLIMKTITEAADKDAYEQVQGVASTIRNVTQQLISERVFWVLSGDDVDINLNRKDKPTLLCVVNYQPISEALAPVISLIATVSAKMMNEKGKQKSVLMTDEGPTLFIPNFEKYPNTGRSNKLITIYMGQDLSQMDKSYGKEVRQNIIGSLSNQFYGNANEVETIKYMVDLFGKEDREIENETHSVNKNTGGSRGNSSSVSINTQERNVIKSQDISALDRGEFLGKVVEAPTENTFFRIECKRLQDLGYKVDKKVPEFYMNDQKEPIGDKEMIANKLRIFKDIDDLKEKYITVVETEEITEE